jgi:hypothetical protein
MMTARSDRVHAFALFRRASATGLRGDLVGAVARANRLDPWRRLFYIEGLGYAAGQAPAAERTLQDPRLPATALVPLCAGVGLALAMGALVRNAELAEAVDALLERCRQASALGAFGAFVEALGFIARLRRSRRIDDVAARVGESDGGDAWRPMFWHGVGRALLFAPLNLLPRGDERMVAEAAGAGRDFATRHAVFAGLAWGLTLVGMRRPAALEARLARAEPVAPAGALERGVADASACWERCFGREATLSGLLAYRAADPARWQARVVEPCEAALARAALRQPTLDELFGGEAVTEAGARPEWTPTPQ